MRVQKHDMGASLPVRHVGDGRRRLSSELDIVTQRSGPEERLPDTWESLFTSLRCFCTLAEEWAAGFFFKF